MSFKVFTPKLRGLPVAPGTVCIDIRGAARITAADLKAVGIAGQATLLIDATGKRIALRRPRENETTVRVSDVENGRTVCVRVGQALKAMGIDAVGVEGRRALTVDTRDRLLMIKF